MAAIKECARMRYRWGRSCVEFDEPNLNLGQRDFQKYVVKTVVGFTQASRFLGTNQGWALPAEDLMDCGIMRVAHIKIRITGRNERCAWGVVHRIKRNEFGNSPKYFYPKMGTLKIANPLLNAELKKEIDEYEDMRAAFHESFFDIEGLRHAEKQAMTEQTKKKITSDDYIAFVVENPDLFVDRKTGELSYSMVQAGPDPELIKKLKLTGELAENYRWNLSAGTTARVKNVASTMLGRVKQEGSED